MRRRKKREEPTPKELLVALSDLYVQAGIATIALAFHLGERNDPQLEQVCELLTAMGDTVVDLNVHLIAAAKQVTTTDTQNTQEGDR